MRILALLMLLIMFAITGLVIAQPSTTTNIEAKAIKKIPPIYPPLARRKRVMGEVKVGLEINSDGTVTNAIFLEGNSLFKPVSLEAARQWVFPKSPSGINGFISFNFEIKED